MLIGSGGSVPNKKNLMQHASAPSYKKKLPILFLFLAFPSSFLVLDFMNSTTTHPPPPTTHPQDNRALSWSQRLRDCLPIITAQQWREIWDKFNVTNLLFVYCLPFFYVFYPALLMPAIFMRTLSFFIGWLYQLIMSHHKDPVAARRRHKSFRKKSSPRRRRHANESNLTGTSASPGPSMLSRSMSSSSSEYDEDDSMEYWLRRCSICLDHKFALCLESCRDQFCKACFQRQDISP